MPAVTVFRHEAVVGEPAQDAVEVVLRDARSRGDLGDGDTGAGGDDLERLLGAWPRALRAPGPLAVGRAAARRDGRRGADGGEGGDGSFQTHVLVAERLELLQARMNLTALQVKKVS